MAKWTLNEWASLAEIISAAAVVLSLVYVGAELRGNTKAVEAATLLEVNRIAREHLLVAWTDADATRIEITGEKTLDERGQRKVSPTCGRELDGP